MNLKILFFTPIIICFILFSCSKLSNKSNIIELIPIETKSGYQYIDWEGKIIINPQFVEANLFYEGLALVAINNEEHGKLYGFIDNKGKYIINPIYKEATSFSEGIAWVCSPTGYPEAINTKGEVQFGMKEAERVTNFYENLAAYSIVDENQKTKWGFIDKKGNKVINPQFAEVGFFKNGFCNIKNEEDKWGYIDAKGNIVINHQFSHSYPFNNGEAIVELDGKKGAIDSKGKFIINPQFDDMNYDENNFIIRLNGKYGWCDKDGKITINPQFDQALPFNNNDLAPVKSGENYGYINKEGRFEINPQFSEAQSFIGNKAIVKSASKIGIIDQNGKYIVNPQFDNFGYDYHEQCNNLTPYRISISTNYFDIEGEVNKVVQLVKNVITKKQLEIPFQESLDMFGLTFKEISNNSINTIYFESDRNKKFEIDVVGYYYDFGSDPMTGGVISRYNPNKQPEGYAFALTINGIDFNQKNQDINTKLKTAFPDYKIEKEDINGTIFSKENYLISFSHNKVNRLIMNIFNTNNGNMHMCLVYKDCN